MPLDQKRFIALLVLAFAGLRAGNSQEQIFRQEYSGLTDTFVEVDSVFGTATRQGSLPFRITIRNNSGEDREWTVTFEEGNYGRMLSTKSVFQIPVENGSEVVREVSFPFAPAFLSSDYRNLSLSVDAPGLSPESPNSGPPGVQTNQSFPTLAISKPLARRSLAKLDELVRQENSANPTFAKPYETAHLPGSWLGYTGLDALLIDLPSWQSLSVIQRQALIAWVRLGGRADIYTDTNAPLFTLNLPGRRASPDTQKISLGEIRLLRWDGTELSDDIITGYRDLAERSRAFDQDFSTTWGLQKEFGIREFNPAIIFLLLVAFAILVAPINLFYLAGPGRRHRLFITTPLISIVTCLVIVVVILVIDGVGGRGIRVVIADLQPSPGEMRLYLSQEQISRTGVMINTGFKQDAEYDINPVNLPPGGFNPFSRNNRNSTNYEFSQGEFRGGLFQSRSEQAFSIRSVEATRARVELQYPDGSAGPPTLISNLSQSLSHLLYVDQTGEFWISPPGLIAPGARVTLEKAPGNHWPAWMKDPESSLSETLRRQVGALKGDRNRFFALPTASEEFALPTHPAIEWEKTLLILTGTPLPLNPPADAPARPAASSLDANE